jgi:hypothetical protein
VQALAAIVNDNLATKQDLVLVKQDILAVKQDMCVLKQELRELEHRLTLRMGTVVSVAVGVVAALVKPSDAGPQARYESNPRCMPVSAITVQRNACRTSACCASVCTYGASARSALSPCSSSASTWMR